MEISKAASNMATPQIEEIPSSVTDVPWLRVGNVDNAKDVTKVGKWMLYFDMEYKDKDGLSELDRVWPVIKELYRKNVLLAVECSTAYVTEDPKLAVYPDGEISCFTGDCHNVQEIESAAFAIREAVSYYPYYMTYKRDGHVGEKFLYIFDVNNEFFILNAFDHNDMFNTGTVRTEETPSRVTDVPWLRVGDIDEAKDGTKVGKWILYLDMEYRGKDGLTKLDRAWIALKKLCHENVLKAAKCSTAYISNDLEEEDIDSDGVICVFTSDCDDVREVESVAIAIRGAVPTFPDPYQFFYYKKSKEWPDEGETLYRFNNNNEFFILSSFDRNDIFNNGTIPVEQIPSRVTDVPTLRVGDIGEAKDVTRVGKWILYPDMMFRGKDGLTELDRVWFAIKKLFHENTLLAAECSKCLECCGNETDAVYPYNMICCFTSNYEDVQEVKSAALAIVDATRHSETIYYRKYKDMDRGMRTALYKFDNNELFKLNID